jgi:hypothetical protein
MRGLWPHCQMYVAYLSAQNVVLEQVRFSKEDISYFITQCIIDAIYIDAHSYIR